MAMSAHFFTSLHPCFKESGTCDGVGKQGLVRHSQSPLRPVFESHDSQYIDRKTRRSPSRWSHSLTLPRAPRTVRTAFYMACFIFTGVSSIPYVCVKFLLRVVPSLKRRGSEENDRQRFPRVQIRVSCLSCVNSLLLTLAEVAVAVPPFVFGGPSRSPLTLTERAAGESEGIPTLTLP